MIITCLFTSAALTCVLIYAIYRAQLQERNDLKNVLIEYMERQFKATNERLDRLENAAKGNKE